MPNWCSHSMLVDGSPEDLAFFKQTMNAPDKWGAIKVLSEEPLIPYPEEFRELDRTCEQRQKQWDEEAKANSLDTMSEEARTTYLKKHPYVRDGYNSGGYEWEKDNYGCKWGFGIAEIVGETENSISYVFQSAWSPPDKLFALMGNKFPNLHFSIDYEEEGMDFAGTYDIHGEDISNTPREITEKCPECDEPVDMCECERCPECGKLLDAEDSDDECDCEAKKKKEQKTREWEERWHKRSSISMPNIDYGILHNAKLNKKTTEDKWYEKDGSNLIEIENDKLSLEELKNKLKIAIEGHEEEDFVNLIKKDIEKRKKKKAQIIEQMTVEAVDISGVLKKAEGDYYWWKIWNLDVIGNDEEGYEVNNRSAWGKIAMTGNESDKEIILILVTEGLLRVGASESDVTIDSSNEETFHIDEYAFGRPLYTIERKEKLSPEEAKYYRSDDEKAKKIREWEERWHKRSDKGSVVEEKVVVAEGLML